MYGMYANSSGHVSLTRTVVDQHRNIDQRRNIAGIRVKPFQGTTSHVLNIKMITHKLTEGMH